MQSGNRTVFLRYWGSHFKSLRQVQSFVTQFQSIAEKGWRTVLVLEHLPADPAWTKALTALGVEIRCLPRPRGNFDWSNVLRVYRLCREIRCTIFHCDNMHTSPLLGAFLAGSAVRVWCKRSMNAHYEECRTPGIRDRLALSTRISYRLASCIVAVSSAVRNELLDLGAPSGRVIVLSNPRPGLRHAATDRDPFRQRLGYDKSNVVILTVGHAVPVKGWDLLLDAFSRVAAQEPNSRLLLVGSTTSPAERAFTQELERRIVTANLASRVTLTGRLEDVGSALAAGDIFVLPSRSEGCCNALLEAVEAGLPCISTEVGNAADVIEPNRNGFRVARNNPEELAEKILTLVKDNELRENLQRNSYLPGTVPTRAQHVHYMTELYETLSLGRSPRPAEFSAQMSAVGV